MSFIQIHISLCNNEDNQELQDIIVAVYSMLPSSNPPVSECPCWNPVSIVEESFAPSGPAECGDYSGNPQTIWVIDSNDTTAFGVFYSVDDASYSCFSSSPESSYQRVSITAEAATVCFEQIKNFCDNYGLPYL